MKSSDKLSCRTFVNKDFSSYMECGTLLRTNKSSNYSSMDGEAHSFVQTEKRLKLAIRGCSSEYDFFKKVEKRKLLNKETLAQVFYLEFCELFRNTFSTEHYPGSVYIFTIHRGYSMCYLLLQLSLYTLKRRFLLND